MKYKLIIIILLFANLQSLAQILSIPKTEDMSCYDTISLNFTIENNYRSCYYGKYAVCYKAKVLNYSDMFRYGDSVVLYIICPKEALSGIIDMEYYSVIVSRDLRILDQYSNNDLFIGSNLTRLVFVRFDSNNKTNNLINLY